MRQARKAALGAQGSIHLGSALKNAGECDCAGYIEAARLRAELYRMQNQAKNAHDMREDIRRKLKESEQAARDELAAVKKATQIAADARRRAGEDAKHMLESMGNIPKGQKLALQRKLTEKMAKNAEANVVKMMPTHTGASKVTHANLDGAIEKVRVSTAALADLKKRIQAIKTAMNSSTLRQTIRITTEKAIRDYDKKVNPPIKRFVPKGKKEKVNQWVPFDSVDRSKAYKYVARENKASYLALLKSANVLGTEAHAQHGRTLTFLEDDAIAKGQLMPLTPADIIHKEYVPGVGAVPMANNGNPPPKK